MVVAAELRNRRNKQAARLIFSRLSVIRGYFRAISLLNHRYGPLARRAGVSSKGDENAEDEDQKGRC